MVNNKADLSKLMNNVTKNMNNIRKMANCDSKCQKQEKLNMLRKKYYKLKNNKENIHKDFIKAEREYLMLSKGAGYYNKHVQDRYTMEIKKHIENNIDKLFNTKINHILAKFNNVESSLLYMKDYDDIKSIYKIAKNRNNKLYGKLKDKNKINKRKAYYDDEYNKYLVSLYNIMTIVYGIACGLLILLVLYKGVFNNIYMMLYILFIFVTPFIMPLLIKNYILLIILLILNMVYLIMFRNFIFNK